MNKLLKSKLIADAGVHTLEMQARVMPAFTPAEMQRTSLANLILNVKMIANPDPNRNPNRNPNPNPNLILKVKMIDPLGAPAALPCCARRSRRRRRLGLA